MPGHRLATDPLAPFTDDELNELVAATDSSADQPAGWYVLTPKLKQLWVARFSRTPPLSINETADVLQVSANTVKTRWREVRELTGIDKLDAEEQGAEVAKLREADVQEAQDIQSKGPRVVTAEEIARLAAQLAFYSLSSMSRSEIKKSSIRDRASLFKICLEGRNLALDKPTQIIDHRQRQALNNVIPMILAEAKRRGISFTDDPAAALPVADLVVDAEFTDG